MISVFRVFLPNLTRNSVYGFRHVDILLSASDDVSGVDQMMISEELDFSDTTWQPFANRKNWLVKDFGTTYIYVIYQDRAGNISTTYSTAISYP